MIVSEMCCAQNAVLEFIHVNDVTRALTAGSAARHVVEHFKRSALGTAAAVQHYMPSRSRSASNHRNIIHECINWLEQ